MSIDLGKMQEELIAARNELAKIKNARDTRLNYALAEARVAALREGLPVNATFAAYKYVYKCLQFVPDLAVSNIDTAEIAKLVDKAIAGYKSRYAKQS